MLFLVRPVSRSTWRWAAGICTPSYVIGECLRGTRQPRGVLGGVPALALPPALQQWIRQSGMLGSLFPGLAVAVDWWNRKITSCKISDAHPDYIPVSRRGDGIYKFSSNQSLEQLGSGSGGQRKDRWDTDERRDREASEPGPTSTSHGGGDCTDESIPKGLREPDHHCSSCSPLPPSSREGEESVAGAGDHRHDRDQTPSTPPPVFPTGQAGQASVKPGPACPNSLRSSLARACRPGKA